MATKKKAAAEPQERDTTGAGGFRNVEDPRGRRKVADERDPANKAK